MNLYIDFFSTYRLATTHAASKRSLLSCFCLTSHVQEILQSRQVWLRSWLRLPMYQQCWQCCIRSATTTRLRCHGRSKFCLCDAKLDRLGLYVSAHTLRPANSELYSVTRWGKHSKQPFFFSRHTKNTRWRCRARGYGGAGVFTYTHVGATKYSGAETRVPPFNYLGTTVVPFHVSGGVYIHSSSIGHLKFHYFLARGVKMGSARCG